MAVPMLASGCPAGCTARHLRGDVCVRCHEVWSRHVGHYCANRSRGSFLPSVFGDCVVDNAAEVAVRVAVVGDSAFLAEGGAHVEDGDVLQGATLDTIVHAAGCDVELSLVSLTGSPSRDVKGVLRSCDAVIVVHDLTQKGSLPEAAVWVRRAARLVPVVALVGSNAASAERCVAAAEPLAEAKDILSFEVSSELDVTAEVFLAVWILVIFFFFLPIFGRNCHKLL